MDQFRVLEVSYKNKEFIALCNELDEYLNIAIGGECKREKYKKYNNLDTMDYVVVAYDEDFPVGCAALRRYSDSEVEVKRVFVKEGYRGCNIGGKLLEQLIGHAKNKCYSRMILETGAFLEASVRLYARFGFERINNYGEYKDMQESFCMGLEIEEDSISYCVGRRLYEKDLRELFISVGWLSANYAKRMEVAFQKAGTVVSAWSNNQLVGLVEVLDDGELNAYIHYLLVRPEFQSRGVGSELLSIVKEKYKHYLYLIVLCEKEENISFYGRMEFEVAEGVTALQIRNV
jgi:GNAT superfamily N-acetyltransferase